MKIPAEQAIRTSNNCLIQITQTYSEWQNSYTLPCRIGLKIFSFIFPAVLKIKLLKD